VRSLPSGFFAEYDALVRAYLDSVAPLLPIEPPPDSSPIRGLLGGGDQWIATGPGGISSK